MKIEPSENETSMNNLGRFSLLTLLIVLTPGVIFRPLFPVLESSLLLLMIGFIRLLVSRKSGENCIIFQQLGAAFVLLCGSLHSISLFPERTLYIFIFACITWYYFCITSMKKQFLLAWLTLSLGLSTGAFSDLFTERPVWVIMSCLISLLNLIRSNRFLTQINRRVYLALFAWICLTLLTVFSGIWSVYPYVSVKFSSYLLFQGLIFIQAVTVFSDHREKSTLIHIILSFTGVYIFAYLFAVCERIFWLGFHDAMGFRIYVFDRHPNYSIFFLLLTLPFWFYLISAPSNWKKAGGYTGIAFALLYLIQFSYSRQSYVQLLVYVIILLYLFKKQSLSNSFYRITIFLTGFTSLVFILNRTLRERALSIIDLSSSIRFNAWIIFFDLIRERPLLGFGMGTNRYIYPQALSYMRPGKLATYPFLFEAHNGYIDILTGTGIAGLSIFIIFLALCTFPRLKPKTPEHHLAYILGAGIWIDFIFNFRLHSQNTGVFALVFLAFCVSINSSKTVGSNAAKRFYFLRYFLATLSIVFCLTPWAGEQFFGGAQKMVRKLPWDVVYNKFKMASIVEPLNAEPHYYMAFCLNQMQQKEKALEEYYTTVNLCPNYPFYRFFLSIALVEDKQFEEALHQLEVAKNLDPYDADGRVRFHLAILEWRFGHLENAIEDFCASILSNPKFINDNYWKTNTDLRRKLAKKLEVYAGAFDSEGYLTPQRERTFLSVLDMLKNVGKNEFSNQTLFRAAWNNPDNLTFVQRSVENLLENEQFDLAKELIFKSFNQYPHNAYLYNYLAYLDYKTGNYQNAIENVQKSRKYWNEIAVDNYSGYLILANSAAKTNQMELYESMKPRLQYLGNGRYQRQLSDLSIHIGDSSFLVNSMQLEQ